MTECGLDMAKPLGLTQVEVFNNLDSFVIASSDGVRQYRCSYRPLEVWLCPYHRRAS